MIFCLKSTSNVDENLQWGTKLLYTPGEICAKITGINPRIIADMAEKGLITPVKDTSGAGSARLYDKQGVFRIAVFCALRGVFSLKLQAQFVDDVLNIIEDDASKTKNCMAEIDIMNESVTLFNVRKPEYWDFRRKRISEQDNPKSYLTYVLDYRALKDSIDSLF